MKITILSAVYGGYDTPPAPPAQDAPGHEVDWLMVSDRDCPGWPTVIEPRPLMHPRLAAKYPKARPGDYTGAEVTIWADGNIRVRSAGFASWCLHHLGDNHLAMTPHTSAATMAREVELAEGNGKYPGQPLREQAAYYAGRGFPDGWGNWWTGLIVRHEDCPQFGDAWLREMFRWGCEDQISLPWWLWQQGLKPAGLPHGWPEFFSWEAHNAEPQWGPR